MADVRKISRSKERLQTRSSILQQSVLDSNEISNVMSGEDTIESLTWKDLMEEQIILLIALTPPELELKLAEIFSFKKYHTCLKEACMVDFYVSAFWFAKQANFTTEQVSAFFSLVKILLENIRDQKTSMAKNISKMRIYLGSSSNPEKTTRISLFNVYQTKLITNYVTESLFQHYKLYELLFSSQPTAETVVKRLLVEVPPAAEFPFPPPLDEGLPENMHSEHVLGLRKSTTSNATADNALKETEMNIQDDRQEENEDIVNESFEPTPELLFTSLKPEEMKQVLKDVSDGILNEVKNNVQKKLKEREATVLTNMSKK